MFMGMDSICGAFSSPSRICPLSRKLTARSGRSVVTICGSSE